VRKRLTYWNHVAKATRNEHARWSFWARAGRFRTVGLWLEYLANAEVLRRERERGAHDPPPLSRLL
jgi:hypothetical protein